MGVACSDEIITRINDTLVFVKPDAQETSVVFPPTDLSYSTMGGGHGDEPKEGSSSV